MKLYPAMRAKMGSWPYFIVRMKMREIAKEVDLAEDLFDDNQLRDHMQRTRNTRRVERDLVDYLVDQEDRLFSSIVVAAVGGSPSWQPVEEVEGVDAPSVFSQLFKDSVGALMFADEPQYYVLDGQHRVSAIKLLADGEAPKACEDGFLDEVLSVIVVLPEDHEGGGRSWRQRYRRLFTSLNRWAEPTDRDTNIIMDEDDRFAIVTRRLISGHSFFSAAGRQQSSYRVSTKGRNLRSGASHFTTLQILYETNQRLLTSATRLQQGWPPPGRVRDPFLQQRPLEEELEKNCNELSRYWDALIGLLPDLGADPRTMRKHDVRGEDNLLFWPIGQLLLADLVRELLNRSGFDESVHGSDELVETLRPLAGLSWDLHEAPWRYLLLTGPHDEGSRWRMRSEDRKRAVDCGKRLVLWLVGCEPAEAEDELRAEWHSLLYPLPDEAKVARCWTDLIGQRNGGNA